MALRLWYINPTLPMGVWPKVGLRNAMGLKKASYIESQIKHNMHIMYVYHVLIIYLSIFKYYSNSLFRNGRVSIFGYCFCTVYILFGVK